jgi:hypothetical protein
MRFIQLQTLRHSSKSLRIRVVRILVTVILGGASAEATAQSSLNVTNFGAKGDAVQFYANTTSNSVVVTTTDTFSGADIGKSIQVFDAGTVTIAPECQDLLATITNVVNGTNLHVSFVAQRTVTNTFCTVGTDNREAFQAAVDAATGATTIIEIPTGNYLLLPVYSAALSGNAAVRIHKGGLRFVGAGTNETVVLGQGAWVRNPNLSDSTWRGFLFAIVPAITNDAPLSFENLTLDGGVPNGRTSVHNFPASPTTGDGWDETHGAIVVRGGGTGATTITQQTWTNVLFRHWRGEMVKSNDTSTNGNLNVFNCTFFDGNATAINIYASLNISNCFFSQLHQVGEYYQAYNTNTSYLQNSLITNISINGWAFNGAKSDSAPFVVRSNTWYLAGDGYNGIMTTPGVNITIQSNNFIGSANGTYAIVLGAAGYQGTYHNSNIVVRGNSFLNCDHVVQIAGATDSAGENRVERVRVFENTITGTTVTPALLMAYNWHRDVQLYSNTVATVADPANGERRATVSSGAYGAEFALVDVNNRYYRPVSGLTSITNFISYAGGARHEIIYAFQALTRYVLVTTNANQIPSGAQILIQNNNTSGSNAPVWLNSEMSAGPVSIAHGSSRTFSWTNGVWVSLSPIIPPANIRSGPGPTN